jgi:hypothetical protein
MSLNQDNNNMNPSVNPSTLSSSSSSAADEQAAAAIHLESEEGQQNGQLPSIIHLSSGLQVINNN